MKALLLQFLPFEGNFSIIWFFPALICLPPWQEVSADSAEQIPIYIPLLYFMAAANLEVGEMGQKPGGGLQEQII